MNSTITIPEEYYLNTTDSCATKYDEFQFTNTLYCNWTWDSYLCWPPTPAGHHVKQKCPLAVHGVDATKFAERRCSADGRWEGRSGISSASSTGWTNYTPCFTKETRKLLLKLYSGNETEIKLEIAEKTRTLEIVGFSLSLAALVLSLVIFCQFRSLRNNRTRIHKNLFVAMVIQVLIRLTLYIDQVIIRRAGLQFGNESSIHGIDNTEFLCEGSYILLEYARTSMFMWMFIEGLYLHNVITLTVFQGRFPHILYALLGWGAPVLLTSIWAGVTSVYFGRQKCWWGYNLTPYYWILEGPRLAVILLNLIFLLNIVRVLVVKLRQSHTSDVEQVRKAVRAAIVLLPLLGITNLLNMYDAPLEKTALEFAIWSYTTHFLTSFQGLFIAMLYCFLNGEVRTALLKSLSVYMSVRGHHNWNAQRQSMFSGVYGTEAEVANDFHERNQSAESETQRNYNWITFCFRSKNDKCPKPVERLPLETSV